MSDLSPPHADGAMASPFDTSTIPLGERAQRRILDHIVAVGDEAETNYLEVKSSLDMRNKFDIAKIAKFLLAVANRQPIQAARHFQGYAVLVVGAEKGRSQGIPRGTEPHDLENLLRPYLGSGFPPFDTGRITQGSDNEVLFIIAPPPQDGQTMFPCRKDLQGERGKNILADGAIYVRGASNSRVAKGEEILDLVERARGGGRPPVKLALDVLGPISRVSHVNEILGGLLDAREERFTRPPKPVENTAPVFPQYLTMALGNRTPLSAGEREDALEQWRSRRNEHIAQGREHFLGVTLPGSGIRVTSHGRAIAKPHLRLIFHGCEVFDHLDSGDAAYEKAVHPVIEGYDPIWSGIDPSDYRIFRRDYPVSWNNLGADAEVILTPDSLRPEQTWATDQDDYVLVAQDPEATEVEVSWTLTEEGSDLMTNGEFRLPTQGLIDGWELFRSTFYNGD
ncbi:hypothetical protein ACT3S7_11325 [Corynebacterium sp. AOP34-AQ2-28]|uniref:hypothetical protein n=1 Tax=Corynebacterium sp. AOP34-AQ2-28 TaxID=3457689 RepID=UPI0040343C5E